MKGKRNEVFMNRNEEGKDMTAYSQTLMNVFCKHTLSTIH